MIVMTNSYYSFESDARLVEYAHVIAVLYCLYSNINDIPISNYSAKSIVLQCSIINLQPFNQYRRKPKSLQLIVS